MNVFFHINGLESESGNPLFKMELSEERQSNRTGERHRVLVISDIKNKAEVCIFLTDGQASLLAETILARLEQDMETTATAAAV